jgi:COP9 signalosome complex subunit 4
MESYTQSVTAAIQSSDYARLSVIFTSQWQSLGQGEQRALASHFIKTAISSPTFFPAAFASPQIMEVIHTTLNHLPPSVENAADNILRQKIFDYKVNEEEDYSTAARILSGLKMEENEESMYYMPPIERCDVFVKVAECYLEEDLTVEAEGAVSKAGTIIEASGIMSSMTSNNSDNANEEVVKDERTITIILRYKSTHARVLDANRKFLQAAVKYHDLSTAYLHSSSVDKDDLLVMLGRAVTCAILSPNSAQRQR